MMREKKLVGRKRHLVVDTLGMIWALCVTPASVQDRDGGKQTLELFRSQVKFPRILWADRAYHATAQWAWIRWAWNMELVKHPPHQFEIQPKRWIVERTFAWLNRSRRLAKDFERTCPSSVALILIAMIQLMVKRIA